MSQNGGKIGWFLGLLAGTTLGMLFAPRKGKEFRKRIQEARKKGKVGHEPVLEDLKLMGEDMGGMAKDLYEGSELEETVSRGRDRLKDISDNIADDVSDFHDAHVKPIIRAVGKKKKK